MIRQNVNIGLSYTFIQVLNIRFKARNATNKNDVVILIHKGSFQNVKTTVGEFKMINFSMNFENANLNTDFNSMGFTSEVLNWYNPTR